MRIVSTSETANRVELAVPRQRAVSREAPSEDRVERQRGAAPEPLLVVLPRPPLAVARAQQTETPPIGEPLETLRRAPTMQGPACVQLQAESSSAGSPAADQVAASDAMSPATQAAVRAVEEARAAGQTTGLESVAYRAAAAAIRGSEVRDFASQVLTAVAIATGKAPPARAGAPLPPPGVDDTERYWDFVFSSLPKAEVPEGFPDMATWVRHCLDQAGSTFAVTASAAQYSAAQQHALHDAGVPLSLGETSYYLYEGNIYLWGQGRHWYPAALNDPAMHPMLAAVFADQIGTGAGTVRDQRTYEDLLAGLGGG